jgi:CRP/FNR family cyclic AMP-dependent transcriptional regulator
MSGMGLALAALTSMPFFAGLDAAALDRVASGTRIRRFRRGEVVFHLGDPGDALFLISSGAVKITLPSETGDEEILATLQPGEVFGELSLLDGAPRSATAVALEPTETIVLQRDRFRDLMTTEPSIRDAVMANMAAEVRRLTTQVEDLHFLDVTGRLAKCLVRLAGEGRPDGNGGIRLRSALSQSELAAMVGCTRQSANRVMGQFTDDGLIRVDRDSITVMNLPGLERAARR